MMSSQLRKIGIDEDTYQITKTMTYDASKWMNRMQLQPLVHAHLILGDRSDFLSSFTHQNCVF